MPKTPEWQEAETGVPARDVRALAREWGTKKTILGAMQGYGRSGYNFGNLQFGSPLDFSFPGYGEGSFSGDLAYSANAANNYQRMPHIVTMSSVRQVTVNRWARMYQHESLKFVVNQSVWKEGETPFADIILPACTVFEKWDIGEWYNVGAGYVHHMYSMNNHRVISMQHKCIEPLGESRSDYNIFLAVAERRSLHRGRARRGQGSEADCRCLALWLEPDSRGAPAAPH